MRGTSTLAGWMWAMLAKAVIALVVVRPLAQLVAQRFVFLAHSFERLGGTLR